MSSLNKVILIGNLGKDLELRHTSNGKAVVNMSVATSERTPDKEYTEWHDVVVWGNLAEACSLHLGKGKQVCVEGRIQYSKYEDKNGNPATRTQVVAQSVKFL